MTSLLNTSRLVAFLMMRISRPTWSPVHTQESPLTFWLHNLFSDFSLDYNQTAPTPPKENKQTAHAPNFLLHVRYSLLPPSGLACSFSFFFFHPLSCSGLEKLPLWVQTWPKMTQLLLKNTAIWPVAPESKDSSYLSQVFTTGVRYQKYKSTGYKRFKCQAAELLFLLANSSG